MRDRISNEYFEWLYDLVCDNRYHDPISFRKLLIRLHDTEFTYLIAKDQNRALDGIDLRRRFALIRMASDGYSYDAIMGCLDSPECSVLEMMIALSIRCEETIMDDPNVGDRTAQWFWSMITNLGLGSMTDSKFDRRFVDDAVARFLDREYEPNGKGGLFTIRRCKFDLRDVEIWHQLCWYLDTIA